MALTSIAAQGQIWYVNPDVDDNQKTKRMKKIRPWLIISPNKANFSSSCYIGFPITHTANPNDEFRIMIECPTKPGKAYSKSWIIPYKPREIDEQDLLSYIGVADKSIVVQAINNFNEYLQKELDESEEDDIDISQNTKIINIADVRQEQDKKEEVEFATLYPNIRYYDKYRDIDSSLVIADYISMYKNNKAQFCKEFRITTKVSKKLYGELIRYYDYLLNKVMLDIL